METTGGSVLFGEESIDAAIREAKEELNVDLDKSKGILICSEKRYFKGCNDIIDVWLFENDVSLNDIKLQQEEVCDCMEAPCGKNPVYHTGKLFTAIGDVISEKIFEIYNIENVVFCTSKMGDSILEPWNISVELNEDVSFEVKEQIDALVKEVINNHNKITEDLINGKLKVNSY